MQNPSSSSSSSFSLMDSITMEKEEQQQKKLIKDHGSKEKNHNMHTFNPNPSQTIMRLASLAICFNVRLKSSDMPPHMQEHALRHTRSLLPLSTPSPKLSNTLIARALKKEFDTKYGLAWHCVIGKSFGSFVSHTGGGFIYFSIDTLSVLLFKTEVHLVRQPPPPP